MRDHENLPSDSRRRGRLILVAGPSGAGKDCLLRAARDALRDHPTIRFARRQITRPADGTHEDHDPVSFGTFERRRAAGQYFLAWEAHGYGYGIPINILGDLTAGFDVVANVSRAIIDAARRQYQPTEVIIVTASPAVLRRRLERRGRETPAAIAARLARARDYAQMSGATVIVNDGPQESAERTFIRAIAPRVENPV